MMLLKRSPCPSSVPGLAGNRGWNVATANTMAYCGAKVGRHSSCRWPNPRATWVFHTFTAVWEFIFCGADKVCLL